MLIAVISLTYAYTPQVVDEHPEWLYSIMDVAVQVIESSQDGATLDVATLIGSICTDIQETAHALSNLKVLRWGPPPNAGQLSHVQENIGKEQLMHAILQSVGAWNPAGALMMVGLTMDLYMKGVRKELATLPDKSSTSSQEGGLSEADKQDLTFGLGIVHDLANMRHACEVSMSLKSKICPIALIAVFCGQVYE